jgi:hypothetical protein
MNTTFIYALCDPRTLEVRYVGKADNPYRRYCQHLVDKYPCYKTHWITSLLKQGFNPILQILEQCDESVWKERERDWIAFERKSGCCLTNKTEGGEGYSLGHEVSDSARKAISYSRLGNKNPMKNPEIAKKASVSFFKKGFSPWNKGKHWTTDQKNKLSDAHKGILLSDAHKKAIGKSLKGRIVTEETRKKIRAQKGWKHTEATKEKMRNIRSLDKK